MLIFSMLTKYWWWFSSFIALPWRLVEAILTPSSIQQVSGFDDSCSRAYNANLEGCGSGLINSQNDVTVPPTTNQQLCSTECRQQIEVMVAAISGDCASNEVADNCTLIGLFFSGAAERCLCDEPCELHVGSPYYAGTIQSARTSSFEGSSSTVAVVNVTAPASSTSTSKPDSKPQSDGQKIGKLIGGILGGFAILGLMMVVVKLMAIR